MPACFVEAAIWGVLAVNQNVRDFFIRDISQKHLKWLLAVITR
jgi:hypothetical protein